jgi:hypothetical protein
VARGERAEPAELGEALERQERAVVRLVAVIDSRSRKRRGEHALGVAVERIGFGGQRGIAGERGGERGPQGAGIADEQAATQARESLEPGRAGGELRIERVREIEAGEGERFHAATRAQSRP